MARDRWLIGSSLRPIRDWVVLFRKLQLSEKGRCEVPHSCTTGRGSADRELFGEARRVAGRTDLPEALVGLA